MLKAAESRTFDSMNERLLERDYPREEYKEKRQEQQIKLDGNRK